MSLNMTLFVCLPAVSLVHLQTVLRLYVSLCVQRQRQTQTYSNMFPDGETRLSWLHSYPKAWNSRPINNKGLVSSVFNTGHFGGKNTEQQWNPKGRTISPFFAFPPRVFVTLSAGNEKHNISLWALSDSLCERREDQHLCDRLSAVPRRRVGVRLW